MKRPFGLVFSAIILLIGSLFQFLMAGVMALSGAAMPKGTATGGFPGAPPTAPMPAWIPVYMYCLSVFVICLGVWGIVTTIGLFRLRRWARYSILVIGGGLALIGTVSMLVTALLVFVPLPLPASADPSQAQTVQGMIKVIFVVVALFYALVGALGIWWLVYFNRKQVRDIFAGAGGQIAESRRPFLIALLAVLNLIGAAGCLLMALLPLPLLLLGFILHGWQKTAICFAFAALQAAVGIGLWRLREWGRRLALAVMALAAVQCVVYVVRPSLLVRYTAELNQIMVPIQPQTLPPQFQTMMLSASFGFSILFCVAIAAVLIHYGYAFQPPIEQNQTAMPQ
jgi:uncharacterized membrane protein (DUF2068 family)